MNNVMTSMNLNTLKERIETLSQFHQIEILKILKNDETCTLNENTNGVFINLTNITTDVVTKLTNYLKYVNEQESQLNEIEQQKSSLSNTFFKDIKDNNMNSNNSILNA
jgi:proline dehydrogenase